MAEAIIAVATAAAEWVATAVTAVAENIGFSAATAGAIGAAAGAIVQTGISVALQYGAQLLLASEPPKPHAAQMALMQTQPAEQYVIHRTRTSGPYALYEAGKRNYDVILLANQWLAATGDIWFHDDKIDLDANGKVERQAQGRYGGHGVWVFTRLGDPDQTSFTTEDTPGSSPSGVGEDPYEELGAGVWTDDHRLRGIAAIATISSPVEQEDFHRVFPNGAVVASVECFAGTYDWRPEGAEEQDPEDVATWEIDGNAALGLAHFLTGLAPDGKADRFDAMIAPHLQAWTTAADDCDDAITLKAGGTEPRYICGGRFDSPNHDADIIKRFIDAATAGCSRTATAATISRSASTASQPSP